MILCGWEGKRQAWRKVMAAIARLIAPVTCRLIVQVRYQREITESSSSNASRIAVLGVAGVWALLYAFHIYSFICIHLPASCAYVNHQAWSVLRRPVLLDSDDWVVLCAQDRSSPQCDQRFSHQDLFAHFNAVSSWTQLLSLFSWILQLYVAPYYTIQ